jgi:hypothetical protein
MFVLQATGGLHLPPQEALFAQPACPSCLETANPPKGGDAKPWAYRDPPRIATGRQAPERPHSIPSNDASTTRTGLLVAYLNPETAHA